MESAEEALPSAESAFLDLGPAVQRTPALTRRRVAIVADRNTQIGTGTIRQWIMHSDVTTRPRDEIVINMKTSSVNELFGNSAALGGSKQWFCVYVESRVYFQKGVGQFIISP